MFEIDLGYHRKGYLTFTATGKCDKCKNENVPVMCVDGSEGEYGEICICQNCISSGFAETNKNVVICPFCGGMNGYHLDGVDCGEYRRR